MTGPAGVLDALRQATSGHAEAAGDGDAVDGVPARFVAAPGSTELESPTNFSSLSTSSCHRVAVMDSPPRWKRAPSSPPLPLTRPGTGVALAVTPRASLEW